MREQRVEPGQTASFPIRVCGQPGYQGPATLRLQMVAEADAHFGPVWPLPLRFSADASADTRSAESTIVRLSNGDDTQIARVCPNGGNCREVGRASYREDREFDLGTLTDQDVIELEVHNDQGGYAWGLELVTGGRAVYSNYAGQAGIEGANSNDQTRQQQTVLKVRLNRNEQALP